MVLTFSYYLSGTIESTFIVFGGYFLIYVMINFNRIKIKFKLSI